MILYKCGLQGPTYCAYIVYVNSFAGFKISMCMNNSHCKGCPNKIKLKLKENKD